MRRSGNEGGFKAIDLVVTVSLIGTLAAIGLPNYVSLKRRAQAAAIKSNMHTLQVALEDFSVQNESFYPTSATDPLPDGRTLAELCPGGTYPTNPFTKATSTVRFNAPPTPGWPGELAVHPAEAAWYRVLANGPQGDSLAFVLTSGQ